jgi:hypothetical protein
MDAATTEIDQLLATLEGMPAFVASAASHIAADEMRKAPDEDSFSFVEQIWHLADLEREGYGVRIRRILAEHEPELADFDGTRIARERRYVELDPAEGVRAFERERAHNVDALRRATAAQFSRGATQDGVGRITLADIPRMMVEHDRGHRLEIQDLVSARSSDRG